MKLNFIWASDALLNVDLNCNTIAEAKEAWYKFDLGTHYSTLVRDRDKNYAAIKLWVEGQLGMGADKIVVYKEAHELHFEVTIAFEKRCVSADDIAAKLKSRYERLKVTNKSSEDHYSTWQHEAVMEEYRRNEQARREEYRRNEQARREEYRKQEEEEARGRASSNNKAETPAASKAVVMPKTKSEAAVILCVSVGAEKGEARMAWLKLIQENHPDRGGDTAKAQSINCAYDFFR